MNLDLLNQLEQKVQTAVESMEVMKRELESLRADKATLSEENEALKAERATWEDRLSELLDKFSGFENLSSASASTHESTGAVTLDDDTLDAEADELLALATEDDELNEADGQVSFEEDVSRLVDTAEQDNTEQESAEAAALAFTEADDSELSEDIFQMEEEDPHSASLASMISEDTQEEDNSSSDPQTPQPGGSHWQIN
ncbi:hypothetical protein BFW38_14180 [Terasakiispira papahanaumokuakeensis]|uniref:Cell division protein ZapB n=1 Tax=Terasakiispira papahanaumokuakeensis TaxID=197479 RepID=A0A1E2VBX3_9GAMM|nr:cell division protein ZapB [Terasakiispira papahanaumokuakeensis]ODC04508.1 hypothetical protein BFW38_14180 [Terasakiispira papahanaumokuakeensis]